MVLVSGQQMATQVCKRLPGGCGGAPGILILPELGLVTAQTNHHHQQRGHWMDTSSWTPMVSLKFSGNIS